MNVGQLKAILKDMNDDVEVVVKYAVRGRSVLHLRPDASVVEDDAGVPLSLLAAHIDDEPTQTIEQRLHFPLWASK